MDFYSANSLKQQSVDRHVTPLGHIILILSQPIFALSPYTAGNRHKQNSRFCKEIREDNLWFWWRRVHEDASQGMYMSKIEIYFFTARILQNQRMLCCGECFHD
jgi:hypothetical protein